MAYSEGQLEFRVRNSDASRFQRAYLCSQVVEQARYSTEYQTARQWESAVILTREGTDYAEWLLENVEGTSTAHAKMALWACFSRRDLLVDVTATDLDAIETLIWSDLKESQTCLPFIYGRVLYDRFTEMFPDGLISELEPADAIRFLRGTPIGIFQVGRYTIGPLGFLPSKSSVNLFVQLESLLQKAVSFVVWPRG